MDAGERLFREFNQKCQNLTMFPNMGKSYAHLKPGIGGLPLDGYIIFYRVVDDVVEIIRVVIGRQYLEVLLFDENEY